MKKIFKVFYSQIFNAFFPILIVVLLLKVKNNEDIASVFLIVNLSNFYLLFSDYSANIVLLKESLLLGGITDKSHSQVIDNINIYIAIKFLFLLFGFVVWIVLCFCIPVLYSNFGINILAYTFIIGYNLNFYWIYMCSNKEYFFIISNFFSRLSLLVLLLVFIYFSLNISSLMFIAGVFSTFITLLFFISFCNKYSIKYRLNKQTLKLGFAVIKRDFNLMSSNFLLMTPTNCLSIFVGYISNTATIAIYVVAEKIYYLIRSLLSIFINSVYPSFSSHQVNKQQKATIYTAFYGAITLGCCILFFTENFIANFLHFNAAETIIFCKCLNYLLLAIIVLSLNVPLMIWAMSNDILLKHKMSLLLLVAAICILIFFVLAVSHYNSIVNIAKCGALAEALVALCFVIAYYKAKALFVQS